MVLLVPVTSPSFLDINVFLHDFAYSFIISQTYVANNYNRYVTVASRRNLGKLISAGDLWGPKVEPWWWFSKYKTNNTCAGFKCILFILNVEKWKKNPLFIIFMDIFLAARSNWPLWFWVWIWHCMLPNISQITGNQTMKYGQVTNITIFFTKIL